MSIHSETFEMLDGLNHLAIAKNQFELSIATGNPTSGGKKAIRAWINKINWIIDDLRSFLPLKDVRAIDVVLDPEITLQMTNIKQMVLELPIHKRNEVERYIETVHRVYKQTKAA